MMKNIIVTCLLVMSTHCLIMFNVLQNAGEITEGK